MPFSNSKPTHNPASPRGLLKPIAMIRLRLALVSVLLCQIFSPLTDAAAFGSKVQTPMSTYVSQALVTPMFTGWHEGGAPLPKQSEVLREIGATSRRTSRFLTGFFLFLTYVAAQVAEADLTLPNVKRWQERNPMLNSPVTQSFEVRPQDASAVWAATAGPEERVILAQGLAIYDGSLDQLLWMLQNDFEKARYFSRALMDERDARISNFATLRGSFLEGSKTMPFQYGVGQAGKLPPGDGWVFRLIGEEFETPDPLNPNRLVPWPDWKPVAGDNAWVALTAGQVYYRQFGRNVQENDVLIRLMRKQAGVAALMQSELGGIRFAPQGTFFNRGHISENFHRISTENNFSWYAAARAAYALTGDPAYARMMSGIERYLKWAWDPVTKTFAVGAQYDPKTNTWHKVMLFATDCQTWALLVLGPETFERWFGADAAFDMLQTTFRRAGVYSNAGVLEGVDFTDYRRLGREPKKSVEWGAGAIGAVWMQAERSRILAKAPSIAAARQQQLMQRAALLEAQAQSMWLGALALGETEGTGDQKVVSFPYASGTEGALAAERETGHGWPAAPPKVRSMASTAWMIFLEENFNPFSLGGKFVLQPTRPVSAPAAPKPEAPKPIAPTPPVKALQAPQVQARETPQVQTPQTPPVQTPVVFPAVKPTVPALPPTGDIIEVNDGMRVQSVTTAAAWFDRPDMDLTGARVYIAFESPEPTHVRFRFETPSGEIGYYPADFMRLDRTVTGIEVKLDDFHVDLKRGGRFRIDYGERIYGQEANPRNDMGFKVLRFTLPRAAPQALFKPLRSRPLRAAL